MNSINNNNLADNISINLSLPLALPIQKPDGITFNIKSHPQQLYSTECEGVMEGKVKKSVSRTRSNSPF
jgi:hypothetical protein